MKVTPHPVRALSWNSGSAKFRLPLITSICSPAAPQYAPVGRTPMRRGSAGEVGGVTVLVVAAALFPCQSNATIE
jgi:hypothetical protein